jgi:hypothetical protein
MRQFNISIYNYDVDMNDIEDEGVEWLVKCPWPQLEAITISIQMN